jgi:demethylmenaquinone methyltransferase/2-methoxy-6-polyprenyl-1,4-benzoquinol methylase
MKEHIMETSQKEHTIRTYRKRAANYDFTANLYYLFEYREWAYRQLVVEALHLKPGDTVLDLACGTGINFPLYQKYIGPEGRIIGVDLTDAMLEQAQKRVAKNGWKNVSLIQHDAASYQNPSPANAVISTYALSIFPGLNQVLNNLSDSLLPGGRLALLELQIPSFWPVWLSTVAVDLMRPFALTDEWVNNRPWEIIQESIKRLFTDVDMIECYFGLTYVISGKKLFHK